MRPEPRAALPLVSAALELAALPLGAAALELAALRGLLLGDFAAPLLCHGAAVLLSLGALRAAAPPGSRRALWPLLPLLLLLPLVAPLGLLLLLRAPPAPAPAATGGPARSFALPTLAPLPPADGRGYSRGGLAAVLRHEPRAARRLQAVMDTRRLQPRAAVEILQVALRDPVDDVRLLAYALLERREQGLQRRIQAGLAALRDAPAGAAPALQRRLATDQFELVHLGLAAGEARDLLLRAARRHLEAALQLRPDDGGGHLLHGRLLLLLGEPAAAAEALGRAEAAGVARLKLLPYLAEAAFQQRRFPQVRALLGALPPLGCRAQPLLDQMRAYWA